MAKDSQAPESVLDPDMTSLIGYVVTSIHEGWRWTPLLAEGRYIWPNRQQAEDCAERHRKQDEDDPPLTPRMWSVHPVGGPL